MAARVTLYYMPISHYCVCAERALAFKGLRPEIVRVPYHDKRALLAATQQDYVPALVWEGRPVAWSDIPRFLEEKRPDPTFFPGGRQGEAEALDEWGHLVVEEKVWRYVVTKATATFEDPVERWVFEEMQTRSRGPWAVLEQRREEFRRELQPVLERVDRMLDGRAWVLGAPSLADLGIFGGLSPLLSVGEPLPEGLPRLAAWVDRVRRIGEPPAPAPAAPPAKRRSPRRR